MLSTKVVGNVNQAQHYFLGHDNYYQEKDSLAQERSEWWGNGAKLLGLEGSVDSAHFTQLLKGTLPDGQQLGKKVENEIQHRPGFDLTFSAPKSVSVLAMIGGDERILLAVQRATDKTLKMVERTCTQARVTKEGVTTYENTKNLVVAKFLHDISREADPQLHVHCVVMNMTQRDDGQWRSLASQSGKYGAEVQGEINGFLERVRHHKLHFGSIFRAELAYEMKQLGYSILKTGKDNFFEIEGISSETIKTYSQRSQQIDSYMQSHGLSSAKAAAVATLKTRKAKDNINRATLDEVWKNRSESSGINAYEEAQVVITQAKTIEQSASTGLTNMAAANRALQYAMAHLSETHIIIKEIQLVNVAMQYALGEQVTVSDVLQTMKSLQRHGDLIALEHTSNETCFMTKISLENEKFILQALPKKNPSAQPIAPLFKIDAYLSHQEELNSEQKHAVRSLFSSEYRINALEGPTGSGKTTLLKPMMELAKLNGYKAIILTTSTAANFDIQSQLRPFPKTLVEWVKQLFDKNEFNTVSGFIKMQERVMDAKKLMPQKGIIFVDNATMLSAKQLLSLISIAEKTDQYLIPLGDRKTLLGFQTGTPFTQMLENGVHHATLTLNLRKQNQEIKSILADTLKNNIVSAFEKVGHRIISIENKVERISHMATHYVGLPSDVRHNTFILMPTKAQCDEMNTAIRDSLKNEGQIHGRSIVTTVLLPKNLSAAQTASVQFYEVGQMIRFNDHYPSLGISRGEYLTIKGVHSRQNQLVMENVQRKTVQWNPSNISRNANRIEIFEVKTREFAAGDKITYRRNEKSLGVHSGEDLIVRSVKDNMLICERDNKKRIQIDLNREQHRHFDYGYATTSLQKHHTDTTHIIAYQNSYSRQSHQRVFYKTLSQAKEQVWIYTENKAAFCQQLQKHTGDKLTAIDSLFNKRELQGNDKESSDYIRLLEKAIARQIERSQQKVSDEAKTPAMLAKEAVCYALSHLTEKEAAFEHKEVLRTALGRVLGDVDAQTLQIAVEDAERKGELVRGLYSSNGTRWTTREGIEIERQILQLAKKDLGQVSPIADITVIEKHIAERQPKAEHAEAIRAICGHTDRHLIVQGYAGTGKTTMLMHVEPILRDVEAVLEKQGYKLLCLAPTHVAVKELKARGLEAQTLDSFLISQQRINPLSFDKLVLAVDESSMASNKQMLALLTIVQDKNMRGIYIGDRYQHPAIEAGKPHVLLQNTIKTIYLTDIERQKEPLLKKAVRESYQGQFADAFNTLKDKIVEIGTEIVDGKPIDNREKRLEVISKNYLSLTPEQRAQVLIICAGNEDRIQQNVMIREELKERGELFGPTLEASILVTENLSETEKSHANNYKPGQIIRFGFSQPELGIAKGDYLTVKEIYKKENYLALTKNDSQQITWQPMVQKKLQRVGVEVYQEHKREIMAGDLIRWTRSDKNLGLLSPEMAKVEAIDKGLLLMRTIEATQQGVSLSKEILVIPAHEKKYQHWDHAYAMTGYSSQGKTIKKTLINFESYRTNLMHQAAFIVALTRAEYDITLYTNNKAALLGQIKSHDGQKTSALETIGEWQDTKSNRSNALRGVPQKAATGKQSLKSNEQLENRHDTVDDSLQKNLGTIKSTKPFIDAISVTRQLHENAELVVERLLGDPKERSAQQYRYGSKKGSLIVTLHGEKRGLWHDHQTGEGGNLLHLVAKQSNLDLKNKDDFKKALEQAVHVLGTQAPILSKAAREEALSEEKSNALTEPKKLSPEQQRSINYARQLAKEALPIKGTLAEKYLSEHRGIALENFPESFRYHPGIYSKINEAIKPALIVIAQDEKGKTQAVQAIFLDEKTANKAQLKVPKQTWGVLSTGVTVNISKDKNSSSPTYLAEGPETGLSIYQAVPNARIKIALSQSNFKNVDPQSIGKDIILCLDNDGENLDSEKLINFAAQRLKNYGKQVWLAKPDRVKTDYNDLLKMEGQKAVKLNLEQAKLYASEAHKNTQTITLKEAKLNDKEADRLSENQLDSYYKQLGEKSNKVDLNKAINASGKSLSDKTLQNLSSTTEEKAYAITSAINRYQRESSAVTGQSSVKNTRIKPEMTSESAKTKIPDKTLDREPDL